MDYKEPHKIKQLQYENITSLLNCVFSIKLTIKNVNATRTEARKVSPYIKYRYTV